MQVWLSILVLAATLATAAKIPIAVGQGGGFTFSPNLIRAAVGDTLVFTFQSNVQHAVAQASMNGPCQPIIGSFYSGDITAPPTTTFSYEVMTSDPIYFYCPVHRHCQSGMVGIVNSPNGNLTLASYVMASKNATNNSPPSSAPGSGGILALSQNRSNSSSQTASTDSAAGGSASVPVATITSTVMKSSETATSTAAMSSGSSDSKSGSVAFRRVSLIEVVWGACMAAAALV